MEVLPAHRRFLLLSALATSVACLAAIAAVDGPLALALRSLPPDGARAVQRAVTFVELLFAFRISPYLYGGLLVAAGLVALRLSADRLLPRALLFVGLSHVTARFLADILKPPFSRLRPFEALGADGWHDTWFAPVGNSFPSGHAVHFWSLYFPLAVLFPRWRVALLALPLLVSAARVAVNHHYLGDVLGSAAVAAAVTWVVAAALLRAAASGSQPKAGEPGPGPAKG